MGTRGRVQQCEPVLKWGIYVRSAVEAADHVGDGRRAKEVFDLTEVQTVRLGVADAQEQCKYAG